jgi:hypothetical protein
MAKLPDVSALGGAPDLRTPRGIVGLDVPKLEQQRAGLVHGAKAVENMAERLEKEQLRLDDTRAEDAVNQAKSQAIGLAEAEGGFGRLEGEQVVGKTVYDDYTKKWGDTVTRISEGLSNARQKELFRQRVAPTSMGFDRALTTHIAKATDKYQDNTAISTVAVEIRNSASNWMDGEAIQASLARIDYAIGGRAERNGWSPEMKEAARLEAYGKVHAGVIQQAIASGYWEYGQAWYNQNKADIDAPTARILERAVEDGTQKQLAAGYTGLFLAARDDVKGLEKLRDDIDADTKIDVTRKNAVLGRVLGRIETLNARAETARVTAERRLERRISQVNSTTLAGYEANTDQLTDLVTAAKGTALEADARQAVALANATGQFRRMNFPAQEAYLTNLQAEVRKDPGKFDVRWVNAFREIHERQKREVQESPVSFAVQQGLVDSAPLDLSEPRKVGPALTQRFEIARGMQARYGAPFKPLTPEEAAAVGATLKASKPEEKREYFASLAQAAGTDFEGYSAVMAQIAPDQPVTAQAGIFAYRGRTEASDLMLRGQAIRQPNRKEDGQPDKGKLWPMPPDTDMRRIFQDQEGGENGAFASRPEARNGMYQAALDIYAAKSADAGDATGILKPDRWKESIRLSTGGFTNYQNKRTILPWGYTDDQFKDGLYRRFQDLIDAKVLAPDMTFEKIKGMSLKPERDGRYMLISGDGMLVDAKKLPVVIDFNESPAWRSSGAPLVINDETPAGVAKRTRSGLNLTFPRGPRPTE